MGKRVVLISPAFFGYEKEIKNGLKAKGYEVLFFDEKNSNTRWHKFIYRYFPIFFSHTIKNYYEFILKEIGNLQDFGYLILLKGESTPTFFIKTIKKRYPKCELVFYNWDSVKNNPNSIILKDYFHRSYSFDLNDCNNYGFIHRPLFAVDDYARLRTKPNISKLRILSIFTIHSDRLKVVSRFIKSLPKESELSIYPYSRMFFFDLIINFKYLFKNRILYPKKESLNKTQILELFKKCDFVLDVNHPKQVGLTIRSIEAIVSSKILVTTNNYIKNYVFYDPNFMRIIDRNNPVIDLTKPVKSTRKFKNFKKLLLLEGWLDEILTGKNYNWIKSNT